METKTLPHFMKEINGRTVTGVFAVHGNVDSGQDMSVNGSFAKRLADGQRKRIRFLWNHNSHNPPIASIKEVREIGREELPPAVLQYAPEATGGVLVTREYYDGVDLASWVLAGLNAGDITEMSYAYDVHEYEYEHIEGKGDVRILKDIELFDISDVNWGMNPATTAVKGLTGDGLTFRQHSDEVVTALDRYVRRVQDRQAFRAKEGRVLSHVNRNRIKTLVASLQAVTADLEQLLLDTDPEKATREAQRLLADFLQIETALITQGM